MFQEYEHMENHYNLEKICDLQVYIDSAVQFVCTEKIHGTNYSFLCDKELNVIPCKRTSTLENDTSFMGHMNVFPKYKDDVIEIFKKIQLEYPNIIQIQLFGELFGGVYDGVTTKNHKKIQKGVNYHKENEFMAYDLKITLDNKTFYYDFNKLVELLKDSKIKLVPVIFTGTLDEVLKLNPAFQSSVYSYFGLPKMKNESELVTEGYVVHPVTEMNYPSDSRKPNERFIFKFKNPIFGEVLPIPQTNSETSIAKVNYVDMLRRYLTINRYDNVISKLGDNEKSKINEMLYKDVLTDFKTDVGEIDEASMKICEKQLKGLVARFLNENKF